MATMQAWQHIDIRDGFNKSLVLNASAPAPTKASLSKGQVLVEVIAAALNPADYKLPEIYLINRFMIKKPATPGLDFCGRVVATHESDQGLHEGQLVFGALPPLFKYGTLGQLSVIPVSGCIPMPDGIDPHCAATVGTAGLTAYQSLLLGQVHKGTKVLINGGGGGTGTFGIQFAKALGAHVTTSCSTANADICRQLGAESVIDYKQVDVLSELEKGDQIFDVVIDNVGTPGLYERSHRFLTPRGKFMQVHFNLSAIRRQVQPACLGGGSRQFIIVGVKINPEDLTQIGQWLKEGKVKPVFEMYDWENVPQAYAKIKTGHVRGKIVVRVPSLRN